MALLAPVGQLGGGDGKEACGWVPVTAKCHWVLDKGQKLPANGHHELCSLTSLTRVTAECAHWASLAGKWPSLAPLFR